MEKKQKEIYDGLVQKHGGVLSNSQKRHLKKVSKRKLKSNVRREKQLEEQKNSSKLIKENNNGQDYSTDFIEKASSWLVNPLRNKLSLDPDKFYGYIQNQKKKYIDLLLGWKDNRDWRFEMLSKIVELYMTGSDGKTIQNYTKSILESTGQ